MEVFNLRSFYAFLSGIISSFKIRRFDGASSTVFVYGCWTELAGSFIRKIGRFCGFDELSLMAQLEVDPLPHNDATV